jgi:CRISPR-associated protein Csx17
MEEHTLELGGCTPTPLMSYLKSLAVLRVVACQKDMSARGFWRGGIFCLTSMLSHEDLIGFFQEEYEPAPVIGPWNNSSGFSPPDKDEGEALTFIRQSNAQRLALYRQAIAVAEAALKTIGVGIGKLQEADKKRLVSELRRHLPDDALPWLDAVLVLTADENGDLRLGFPPLLGTGGNDGRMDISVNFMSRLHEVFTDSRSQGWLADSLYGSADTPSLKRAIGFFGPSAAGGANVDQGFEAPSVVNPWDFVLMIEGTLFFAGSVSRRYAVSSSLGYSAYPFTVNPSAAGYGSAAGSEERGRSSRGELWMPLWERPATVREISSLFSEGRARLGRRPARDGVDFTRALASLGTSRGVSGFVRYGLAKRRGDAYIASPVGFYKSRETSMDGIGLLNEIDSWLMGLDRAMGGSSKEMPHGLKSAVQNLKESMHSFAVHGGTRGLQGVVIALGNAEHALVRAGSLWKGDGVSIWPLTLSDPDWLKKCDDGSPEFRCAAAIASIVPVGKEIGPFRAEIEPITLRRGFAAWNKDAGRITPVGGSLSRLLAAVIEHRCFEGMRHELENPPVGALFWASLEDVSLFLEEQLDERKTLSLLLGLSLLKPAAFREAVRLPSPPSPSLPRDYVLLKAHFLPSTLRWNGEKVQMGSETALVPLLRASRVSEACRLAERRLRVSGVATLSSFGQDGIDGVRLLASLLVPVEVRSFERYALPMVLKKEEELQTLGGEGIA